MAVSAKIASAARTSIRVKPRRAAGRERPGSMAVREAGGAANTCAQVRGSTSIRCGLPALLRSWTVKGVQVPSPKNVTYGSEAGVVRRNRGQRRGGPRCPRAGIEPRGRAAAGDREGLRRHAVVGDDLLLVVVGEPDIVAARHRGVPGPSCARRSWPSPRKPPGGRPACRSAAAAPAMRAAESRAISPIASQQLQEDGLPIGPRSSPVADVVRRAVDFVRADRPKVESVLVARPRIGVLVVALPGIEQDLSVDVGSVPAISPLSAGAVTRAARPPAVDG